MHVVAIVMLAGWALFWIGWLLAATGVKSGRTNWRKYAGARLLIAVLVIVAFRSGAHGAHGSIHAPWATAAGLVMWVAGLALAVWARVHIGRNWGTPMTQKDDPELITTGPYRLIRHPIYSGIILAFFGTAVALNLYVLVVALLFGAYFVYSATQEEKYMTERFPDSYPAYRRTSKMLIPFVF